MANLLTPTARLLHLLLEKHPGGQTITQLQKLSGASKPPVLHAVKLLQIAGLVVKSGKPASYSLAPVDGTASYLICQMSDMPRPGPGHQWRLCRR